MASGARAFAGGSDLRATPGRDRLALPARGTFNAGAPGIVLPAACPRAALFVAPVGLDGCVSPRRFHCAPKEGVRIPRPLTPTRGERTSAAPGWPPPKFGPGAVAGAGYSPFIRIAGSNVIYNAPIVATGNGPFDVVHHTNTGDRVLGIHIAGKSKPGQFAESWADLLFVKSFDAGQPILYLSTDAGQPLTAVLERSV